MNLPRLFALAALASAFALSACGNKADLYLPAPPPAGDAVEEDWEPVEEEVIEDEAASQQATGLPLPVPTGDDPDQPPAAPVDDDSDPPPDAEGDPDGDG